jgi:hypothetical protein
VETDLKTMLAHIGQLSLKVHLLENQLETANKQSDYLLGNLAEVALGRLKPNRIEVNMSAKTLTILPVTPADSVKPAQGEI